MTAPRVRSILPRRKGRKLEAAACFEIFTRIASRAMQDAETAQRLVWEQE